MFGSFSSSSPPAPRGLPFDGFTSRPSPPTKNALTEPPSNSEQSKERPNHAPCTNQFFLSPDGRSHHSYHNGEIISCFAPFNSESMKVIASLPAAVQRAVSLDPILGFICVGEGAKEKGMIVLPWMCLYTSSSAFLFSIGYTSSPEGETRGTILRLLEPFEKPLLSPLAPQIVCLRCAPEIARPGAMACMLKENDGYSVVLYHGVDDGSGPVVTTTPLRFSSADLLRGRSGLAVENLAYDSLEVHIVDFCFVSIGSILILSNDGGVYGASPILFDGVCVPRSTVDQMVSRLNDEIQESSAGMKVEQEARVRQCKAARQYWMDAFGLHNAGDSYYVSAAVVHGKKAVSQAMSWQPRIQGPLVMVASEEEKGVPCQCIEAFGGTEDVVEGFVVAGSETASSTLDVAFGIVPGQGSVLMPRFEFEMGDDCYLLDDLVRETGVIVERAVIKNNTEEEENSGVATASRALVPSPAGVRSCSLVIDPLDDLMVHVTTKTRIVTSTTNSLAVAAQCFRARMEGKGVRDANANMSTIRTKVWSSLDSTSATLVGAGVSKDVHMGHILVAKMSDGSTEVVNITTAQCIHEASLQMDAKMNQLQAIQDDSTPNILRNVKPLNELLQPLTDKVCNGLSKMGKIVGGNTKPKDVGPENLAMFLETQRSCGQDIVLPMEEITRIVNGRKDLMKEMNESQLAELQRLGKLIDDLKSKYESSRKKVAELEAESTMLVSRSSAVLTATRDLRPQITEAEAQYFKDLERNEIKCNQWEDQVKQISNDADSTCKAMSAGAIENGEVRCLLDLPADKIDLCVQMMHGEKQLLKNAEHKINTATDALDQISSADTARIRMIEAEKENVGQ